jgi:hypothetical protein
VALVERPAPDTHPVLVRARELGMTVVREQRKPGFPSARDGATLRVASNLTNGDAWSLVSRDIDEFEAELREAHQAA